MVIGRAPGWYLQVGMQRGAPVCKCVLCGCTRNTVPIDGYHVPCCKGRARLFFSFFKKKKKERKKEVWLKLESVCCHSQHSRLHCKRQGNVTTPSWWGIYFILLFLFFGGEEASRDLTWNPLVAHLVYLSKLLFLWPAQQLAGVPAWPSGGKYISRQGIRNSLLEPHSHFKHFLINLHHVWVTELHVSARLSGF